jgi:hypothetical protein
MEIKVKVPTQIEASNSPTQLSDDDNVTINLLEQELDESRQQGNGDTRNQPTSARNGDGLYLVW